MALMDFIWALMHGMKRLLAFITKTFSPKVKKFLVSILMIRLVLWYEKVDVWDLVEV